MIVRSGGNSGNNILGLKQYGRAQFLLILEIIVLYPQFFNPSYIIFTHIKKESGCGTHK